MSIAVREYVYLDTSAVLRWAFAICGSPSERDRQGHAVLERVLESDAEVALTPITLIEVVSNLNSKIRAQDAWYAEFSIAHAEAGQTALMGHMRSGRIQGRNLGPRAFSMAMMYVAEAFRVANVRLLAWDALHLHEAVRWSQELGDQVTVKIATSDSGFAKFLSALPELGRQVEVLDVVAT